MVGLSVLDVLTFHISANQNLDFSFSIMGQHDDLEMYGTFFNMIRLIQLRFIDSQIALCPVHSNVLGI